jgi:hypothetical protein
MSSCHQTSIFGTLGQHWTTLHWSSLADWLPGNRKWQWPLETPPARRNWADFVLLRAHWRSPTLVEVHQRPETGRCKNVDEYEAPWDTNNQRRILEHKTSEYTVFYSICSDVFFNYPFFAKPLLMQSGLECILPPSYCSAVKTFK